MKIQLLHNSIIKVTISMLILCATLFAQGHTFATFNTGTITGGGAEFTRSFDVTGLTNDYLFIVVSADFVSGANPVWSQTILMELDNSGSTIYKNYSSATTGALANENPTTLIWSGLLQQTYTGGTTFRIKFKDTYTDASGPYTSELQNVTVTIYVTPTPVKSFSDFNTGTITGGAAPVDEVFDVTGLTYDYLFYVVSADFVAGGNPAWSQTIQMQLDNNGATIYKTFSGATTGALSNANSTTMIWTGVMERIYAGGGALRARFKDVFTDGDGPYTSELNNISVKIFPAPAPNKEFSTYNTGTITGGGAEVIQSVDVTGLTDNYLFYVVSADFVAGGNPAWSQTIVMELDNGGSTIYKAYSGATTGALANANPTTLIWTGVMYEPYAGGSTFRVKFKDNFTDGGGPYTSELQNVSVTIYSEPSTTPLPVELISFEGFNTEDGVVLEWETATETNNYGFEIQKLEDRSQESEWTKIGFVHGHGTTNSPKYYEFTDYELPEVESVDYRLKQIDNDGTFAYSKTITVDLTSITSVDDEVVYEFALEQNFPNPFNPSTNINFTIPSNMKGETSNALLIVYDVLGREVSTLVNQKLQPGNHEVQFDGSSLSSGMYFYRISIGNEFNSVRKMMLVK